MASDDLPRHLRIALANAERAIRAGDHAALGTINETIQPLVDAAMARISKSEAALRIEHDAHSALLTATRADRDRLRVEASEARARIAVLEEEQRRDLADVEHFRTMARGYMDERDRLRAERDNMRGGFESCVRLATWTSEHREALKYDGCGMAGDEAIVLMERLISERDRLADILACERGERAPVGWVWTTYAIGDGNTHGEWQRRAPGIVLALSVWRGKEGTWHWQVHPPGGTQQGVAPTALEAIEAADLAAKERP